MFALVFVAAFDSNITLVVVCKIENQQDRGGGGSVGQDSRGGGRGGGWARGGWRTKVILLGLY